MTALDLDAIKGRAADSAQAEQHTDWEVAYDGDYYVRSREGWFPVTREMYEETAVFLAHAIKDVPALVAEVERLEAVLAEALGRVRASSIPLGMSEQQFNAATILEMAKILSRPAVERTSDSSSTGSQS